MAEQALQNERSEENGEARRLLWPCLFAILAGLAVVLYALFAHWPGPSRLNPRTWCRVRLGMTQQQVEEGYGVPPGDYSSRPDQDRPEISKKRRPDLRGEEWVGEGSGAIVDFGPDGKVAYFEIWTSPTNPPGLTWRDRLDDWVYILKGKLRVRP